MVTFVGSVPGVMSGNRPSSFLKTKATRTDFFQLVRNAGMSFKRQLISRPMTELGPNIEPSKSDTVRLFKNYANKSKD